MRLIAILCLAMLFAGTGGRAEDQKDKSLELFKLWAYPGAEFDPTDGPYYRIVMTTPDNSVQVLRHYEKVALPVVGRSIAVPGGGMSIQTDEMLTDIRDLSSKKARGLEGEQKASSVSVHTVMQDHPDYCVHVFITQAKDEKKTQIFLSYLRKKAAANQVKEAKKDELKLLQGVWKCVDRQYTTAEGKKAAHLQGVHFLTVTDNKFKVEVKDHPPNTGIVPAWGDGTGTLNLDASQSPKQINIKGLGSREGIYKLDENRFTVLLTFFVGRKGRPESFEDTKGTVLLTFEKATQKE